MEQPIKNNIDAELRELLGSIALDCRRFAVNHHFKDLSTLKRSESWIRYGTEAHLNEVHVGLVERMKTSDLAQSLLIFVMNTLSKYVLHRLSTAEEAQRRIVHVREIIRTYGENSGKLVSLLVVLGDIARIVEPELEKLNVSSTHPEKTDSPSAAKTGIDLIAEERRKQLEKHSLAHDLRVHSEDQLAMAAALCASPSRLYAMATTDTEVTLSDPWPFEDYDPRPRAANGSLTSNDHLPYEDRVKQLTVAGALLAAEIDRLNRIIARNEKPL